MEEKENECEEEEEENDDKPITPLTMKAQEFFNSLPSKEQQNKVAQEQS